LFRLVNHSADCCTHSVSWAEGSTTLCCGVMGERSGEWFLDGTWPGLPTRLAKGNLTSCEGARLHSPLGDGVGANIRHNNAHKHLANDVIFNVAQWPCPTHPPVMCYGDDERGVGWPIRCQRKDSMCGRGLRCSAAEFQKCFFLSHFLDFGRLQTVGKQLWAGSSSTPQRRIKLRKMFVCDTAAANRQVTPHWGGVFHVFFQNRTEQTTFLAVRWTNCCF
jgi:hypothetical protein